MDSIFGDKEQFAIQVMLEPELKPPSHLWGRMCLWVCGLRLGDYDETYCGLAQCVSHLNGEMGLLDQLWDDGFENKPDHEIYRFLEASWLDLENEENWGHENEELHRFRFDYGFPKMFDHEPMSFLIKQPDGRLKVLFKKTREHAPTGHVFSEKLFVDAIRNFNRWFDEMYALMDSVHAKK